MNELIDYEYQYLIGELELSGAFGCALWEGLYEGGCITRNDVITPKGQRLVEEYRKKHESGTVAVTGE